MKAWICALGLMAWSLGFYGPAQAQDGNATLEEKVESATDPGLNGAAPSAAPVAPRDPNIGVVTNLPIPRFVSLKGSQGNARRGPGLTHMIDWVFTREGMPLKVTAEYEHWRRVEDIDGAGGWIHYSLLSGVRAILVTQDMAQAFATPDPTAQVLYQAEAGVVGKLVQCIPIWCRVSIEGEKGWMLQSTLWGVQADEVFP